MKEFVAAQQPLPVVDPMVRFETAPGSVEFQDSHAWFGVIQALDGTLCFDGRPMGENGTALPGEAIRPRA